MALHNRKLSFTTPIVVGFAGILLSFMLIIFYDSGATERFLEDYHDINRNFTANTTINYARPCCGKMILSSGGAAAFFARNDELNRAVNVEPEKGLTTLMQLQNMMPSVSSISLADTEEPLSARPGGAGKRRQSGFRSSQNARPWFIKQAEAAPSATTPVRIWIISATIRRYHFQTLITPGRKLKGLSSRSHLPWGSRCIDGGARTGFCGAAGWQSGPALRPGRAV